MAVEAPHMNLFPAQLITNRGFLKTNQESGNLYNTQMDSCLPLADTMQQDSLLFPLYQSLVCDPISAKASINKADSGLTYNMNIPVSSAPRKRPRDSFINGFDSHTVSQKNKFSGISPVLDDDDVFFQIQQQNQEIDRFIAEHTEKVRFELEERRKKQSRMLITAIQEGVMKKLMEKDEELQRMGKLNWILQERVRSLYVDNQLWRDLAETNEATANSLRTNLEQVLAHFSEEQRHVSGGGAAAALAADAESSCGSSDEGWRKVVPPQPQGNIGGGAAAGCVQDKAVVVGNNNNNNRNCRKCGERGSSVLLLPCRHLCLCTICGSTLVSTCPVCDSVTNASVHVNMS